ncbi:MAG: hypothetical protein KJ069_19325 [Anaerolineae bacterium]|nr:hypothetical protein [Anaerolineae bacterium]
MMNRTAPPSPYTQEAETFVTIMRGMAPDITLDYSGESIAALEAFIAARFDPPGSKFVGDSLPVGIGCYVGEVIIRTLGGRWAPGEAPEIHQIGNVQKIFPLDKTRKRFQNGPVESLAYYYETIARHAAG